MGGIRPLTNKLDAQLGIRDLLHHLLNKILIDGRLALHEMHHIIEYRNLTKFLREIELLQYSVLLPNLIT